MDQKKKLKEKIKTWYSVVESNTLNLDPECWFNLDPDPGLFYQF